MNKNIILVLLLAAASTAQAQSMKDIFLKMPQTVCPALSEYNRLELVDNQLNNKPMQTRNQLSNLSHMQTLTDEYAHLIVSKNSEKQFKLLPLNNGSNIILAISTVRSDSIYDSSISFYTTDWQPLDATIYCNKPTSADFRRIAIAKDSNNLIVTVSHPLSLQTDGTSNPVSAPSETEVWIWNKDENKYTTFN